MTRMLILFSIALTAVTLFGGCASQDEESLTWTERWKAMARRQDAAARDFVDTDRASH